MCSTFYRIDIIDVAVDILVVGGVIGHRYLYGDALLLRDDVDYIIYKMLLRAVNVLGEFLQSLLGIVDFL